ncbi:hypothetical protein BOX15_Mlig017896g3 [Macrostomum lignano]|uniref:Uncharacterized protein n=2 Tax=Macrostomum lignano TaxID=282301 RepID=A0A267GFV7_9PLAT|nr:hypothetical protein BOX15_Mlig017896g3 [Macrostomum lignano]
MSGHYLTILIALTAILAASVEASPAQQQRPHQQPPQVDCWRSAMDQLGCYTCCQRQRLTCLQASPVACGDGSNRMGRRCADLCWERMKYCDFQCGI